MSLIVYEEMLLLHRFEALGEHGDNLVEVAHDAEVGNAEDGGELVLVDGNDQLALFHTGKVLNGTADTAGKIEVGTNGLTGLSHLTALIHDTGINHSTAAGHFAFQLLGILAWLMSVITFSSLTVLIIFTRLIFCSSNWTL